MVDKTIKVKANESFQEYRNKVLGLPKKDFRALQRGDIVPVSREFFRKYNHIIYEVKKDGN